MLTMSGAALASRNMRARLVWVLFLYPSRPQIPMARSRIDHPDQLGDVTHLGSEFEGEERVRMMEDR